MNSWYDVLSYICLTLSLLGGDCTIHSLVRSVRVSALLWHWVLDSQLARLLLLHHLLRLLHHLLRLLHHLLLLLLRLLHVDLLLLLSRLLHVHHLAWLAVLSGLHVDLLLLLGDLLIHHLLLARLSVVDSCGGASLMGVVEGCAELLLSSLLLNAADDTDDGSDANDRADNRKDPPEPN